jgi:hypothetical protein
LGFRNQQEHEHFLLGDHRAASLSLNWRRRLARKIAEVIAPEVY